VLTRLTCKTSPMEGSGGLFSFNYQNPQNNTTIQPSLTSPRNALPGPGRKSKTKTRCSGQPRLPRLQAGFTNIASGTRTRQPAASLEASVEPSNTDRTEQDILFELLLKLGLDSVCPLKVRALITFRPIPCDRKDIKLKIINESQVMFHCTRFRLMPGRLMIKAKKTTKSTPSARARCSSAFPLHPASRRGAAGPRPRGPGTRN